MKIVSSLSTVVIFLSTVQTSIGATTSKPVTPQQPTPQQPTPKRGDGRRIYAQMIETWRSLHTDTSK